MAITNQLTLPTVIRKFFKHQAHRIVCSLFGWLVLCVQSLALAADDTYQAPASLEKIRLHIELEPSGRYVAIKERITRIETLLGVSRMGNHQQSYVDSQQSFRVIDAHTLTPEGKQIPLSKRWIKNHQSSQDSDDLGDEKTTTIVFPEVAIGSRLYSKTRLFHHKPTYPGKFSYKIGLPPYFVYENVEITLSARKPIKLYFSQRGFTGGLVSETKHKSEYRFVASSNRALRPEDDSVDDADFAPYLAMSTYRDHLEIGDSYQSAAKPKARVTPDIARLANQLTKDVGTERDKARLLYNWVSRNIRYVSASIGAGRVQPHAASEVLRHRFGDCKDHVVLLEALLEAVGIPSSPALINSGDAFDMVNEGGDVYPINHVITYLPSLDLYLDSTAQFAPFGSLPSNVLDKPTVLTALHQYGRTPAIQAESHTVKTEVRMQMQPNGAIVGSSSADMKGYPEINSRATRFSTELEGQEKIVRDLFFRFNEIGDGRMSWTDPMALDAPYSVHASFNLAPIADLTTQGAFQIPVGLAPGRIAVLGTFKPFEDRQFPYVCNSHVDDESYTLELPESIDITQTPKDIDFSNEEISFSAKYERTGNSIKITRRLVIQYPSRVCQPKAHHRWKEVVELIRSDYKSLVFYKPSKQR